MIDTPKFAVPLWQIELDLDDICKLEGGKIPSSLTINIRIVFTASCLFSLRCQLTGLQQSNDNQDRVTGHSLPLVMAPKKNPNAGLKNICLRDPDDKCSVNHVNVLKKCPSVNISNLWPDFKDDPSNANVDKLADADSCNALLDVVFHINQNSCNLTAHLDAESSRRTMAGAKSKGLFKGVPITKQMLEHAFQTVRKGKGKATTQQQTNTTASSASSSANAIPVAANSSTSTGVGGLPTSTLSALQITNPAPSTLTQAVNPTDSVPSSSNSAAIASPAPVAGTSSANQTVPPTIASSNPQNELLQAVPEVGVGRPPRRVGASARDKVTTNYFRVDLPKITKNSQILHEYQIVGLVVDPPNDLSKSKKKVIIKRFVQQSALLSANVGSFASNGEGRVIAWRCLDPNTPINNNVLQQNVPDYDRNQHNVVSHYLSMSLNYVRTIDLNDLERYARGGHQNYGASVAEEAVNILVGQAVANSDTGSIPIGDNHFFTTIDSENLPSWGMVALRGYTSHAKARQGGLFLNVNTALSAFYRVGTVDWYIRQFARQADQYPHAFLSDSKATQHLTGVRVRIMYDRDSPGETGSRKDTPEGRLKSITGFSINLADQTFFINGLGARISVWQHFLAGHPQLAAKSALKGKQICVNTSGTQAGRECWFLSDQLEVIQGQIYRKTLDRLGPDMTAAMIAAATKDPSENQNSIESWGMPALGFAQGLPDPALLTNAGIRVNRRMIDVPSRQIPSPKVIFGNNNAAKLSGSGQWRTTGIKFMTQDRSHFQGTDGVVFYCPPGGLHRQEYGAAYIGGFQRTWQLSYDNILPNIQVNRQWQFFPQSGMDDLQSVVKAMRASKAGLVVLVLPAINAQICRWYANFRIAMDQVTGNACCLRAVDDGLCQEFSRRPTTDRRSTHTFLGKRGS